MTGPQRFELRYGRLRAVLFALGLGPASARVEVDDREVRVRMGWAFRVVLPRGSITSAKRDKDMRWGIGVHGGRGRWLVNGSTTGIVTLAVDPPVRGRVLVVPVRVRRLHVSLADPEGFLTAVGARNPAGG